MSAPVTAADVARRLHSLSGVMGEAARSIERNGDLLDIDWGDVDGWITDLEEIQTAIEEPS